MVDYSEYLLRAKRLLHDVEILMNDKRTEEAFLALHNLYVEVKLMANAIRTSKGGVYHE
ncbi:MAG: hypothetical protein ACOYLM_07090 [Methylococcaceae bacterium]|jgi:hypothetical protein